MPMPNLDPSFELGKRLSGFEQRIRAIETKVFPIGAATAGASAVNFAVPTAVTTVASATLEVPAPFATVIITANAEIFIECQPATATGDWGYGGIEVNSSDGQHTSSGANGVWGTASGTGTSAIPVPLVAQFPSCSAYFTGLVAGTTITVSVQVWSGLGWTANSGNLAEIRASATFLP